MCAKSLQWCVTIWTVACQAPLSMWLSRQEYWSGWPCPPPGDLPDPGIEPFPLRSPTLAGRFFTTSTTWEAQLTPYPELFRFHLFLSSLLSCQSPIPGCFILNTNPPGTDPGGWQLPFRRLYFQPFYVTCWWIQYWLILFLNLDALRTLLLSG